MDTLIQLGQDCQAPLEAAKAAFFASGGQIRHCDLSETQYRPISVWNTAITKRKFARRDFEQKESQLADLIRQNATVETEFGIIRRTPTEVRNKLRTLGEKLTTPQVEQIAAKFRIELAEGGKLR